MTKRTSVGWIYFVVVLCTLLLRIASALDIYSTLNIKDSDAFFSCVVQIAIFAFISVFLYSLYCPSMINTVPSIYLSRINIML